MVCKIYSPLNQGLRIFVWGFKLRKYSSNPSTGLACGWTDKVPSTSASFPKKKIHYGTFCIKNVQKTFWSWLKEPYGAIISKYLCSKTIFVNAKIGMYLFCKKYLGIFRIYFWMKIISRVPTFLTRQFILCYYSWTILFRWLGENYHWD